ncbi:MAG: acetolactate synthase large subunit [Legionellaceae bacterium]|nr:acetolactate synthase large subunit [Legionellaceae bacterium]
MNTADLLLQCLKAHGVNTMYGVPGEENADVVMALSHQKDIQFITCRHEQTGAFMAEMHGRLTGIPGICLATLGPGATNLTTGVAQANFDVAPLIAIIGQGSTHRLHKMSHQNIDAIAMFKPITKWVVSILSPEVLPEIVAKAFKIATMGSPGAVVIELPEDIAALPADGLKPLCFQTHTYEETPSLEFIQRFLELFSRSKKPLVLLGEGAVRTECDAVLATFLEKTGCYAAYTFMGKGCIGFQYPRSLHCVGLGLKDLAIEAFEQADLVICIGYNMIEWSPSQWNIGVQKHIIHIHSCPAEIDVAYPADLEMIGYIPSILSNVQQVFPPEMQKKDPYFHAIQQRVEKDIRGDSDDLHFPMKPKTILRMLRDTLGKEDILVSDVGAHKMWVARQYGAYYSKTCFISNGFCSMGGSIPGAVEAKRLNPQKNVVALCGDGGFVMSIQALFTAVSLQVPIVVLLWNDDAYGLIAWKQNMHFHAHAFTDLNNPDLAEVAKKIGCHARKIASAEHFVEDLRWALSHQDKPTVLEVPVDYSENMKLFHHLEAK